ncbi:GntR family transcriptional regulator [Ketogulonicigenium vulgare]|uniref:GntR-family transcriptional regulator n=2 Tax=Ketogulonicigenium vulgare TaxID=92945 RepID=F9Y7Z6_KETVW|nr:GntR family transcriptional regulator [Ketogulonicigenium vulgare]ADO42935.1 GntR family transcriptional regulator [Ketogulonicigenium vulgare Y25]AEM41122.1 GntR-family transcriptional regulator [Ketogulonicigenium vulgare WSH-001]ALJ81261.1 GntR family transcriptional regulator [Ketogulonicigenium vulgare]ANW34002.1 GntR family transcriptional regulator [Ketogulonicigenium vulgare]AOZ54844.1 GntR family transcriptional regulator [Ketogulonicigenium vulgare]
MGDQMTKEQDDSLVDRVYSRLLGEILNGTLAPGAKLSEPKIAATEDVSRAPVREAIRRLEERGLVTHRLRQGVRVIVPDETMRANLMAVRGALEGLAARQAAENATDSERASLAVMLDAHRDKLEREGPVDYWQSNVNTDFHHRVATLSRNSHLIDLINDRFWPLFQLVRRARRDEPGRIRRSYVEHRRIANAIIDRDGDVAELLMRRHIEAAFIT